MKFDPVNNLNCIAEYVGLKYYPKLSKITKN